MNRRGQQLDTKDLVGVVPESRRKQRVLGGDSLTARNRNRVFSQTVDVSSICCIAASWLKPGE
jgi:hypothetical protein